MAERKSFLLRIDGPTLDMVKRWADDDFRSLNGQVEYLLREALKRSGRWKTGNDGDAPGDDSTAGSGASE